jgi:hypothetical protein
VNLNSILTGKKPSNDIRAANVVMKSNLEVWQAPKPEAAFGVALPGNPYMALRVRPKE